MAAWWPTHTRSCGTGARPTGTTASLLPPRMVPAASMRRSTTSGRPRLATAASHACRTVTSLPRLGQPLPARRGLRRAGACLQWACLLLPLLLRPMGLLACGPAWQARLPSAAPGRQRWACTVALRCSTRILQLGAALRRVLAAGLSALSAHPPPASQLRQARGGEGRRGAAPAAGVQPAGVGGGLVQRLCAAGRRGMRAAHGGGCGRECLAECRDFVCQLACVRLGMFCVGPQRRACAAGGEQGRGQAGQGASQPPGASLHRFRRGAWPCPSLEECAWRRLAAVHPSLTQPGPAAGIARRRRAICLAPGSSAAPSQSPT